MVQDIMLMEKVENGWESLEMGDISPNYKRSYVKRNR
jgi:hypothetical protein